MKLPRIGVDLTDKRSATGALQAIARAEAAGVPMLWSTVSRGMPDPTTYFAAAAVQTDRLMLGTAIVPTYPRHPAMLASQALALAELSANRFRLGIGPSHRPTIEGGYGIPMERPLDHLREYLTVLRSLLRDGSVDFSGEYFHVQTQLESTAQVPVYISALRENAFRLAGDIADGAISWLCPLGYLRDRAIPAMQASAEAAGRETPRMVAHVPVVMTDDRDVMLQTAGPLVSRYGRLPFYANMFLDAGHPVGSAGVAGVGLLDHLIVWGDDARIAERITAALGGGIDEILLTLFPVNDMLDEESRLFKIVRKIADDQAGTS